METLTLCHNLINDATSQYQNFRFNSSCEFNGKKLFMNSSGLFEHTGLLDNGEPISMVVGFPATDFSIIDQKRLRAIYLSGMFAGDIQVTVTDDGENASVYTGACLQDEKASSIRVYLSRKNKGRFFAFEVTSLAETIIDSIKLLVNPVNRKAGI